MNRAAGSRSRTVRENQAWPQKTRDLHHHHMDSRIWDEFAFRDDDIIIATYAKSGTTWIQQIVSQLLFDGASDLDVATMSPRLDLRVPPRDVKLPALSGQQHRRFVKTHLPVEALVNASAAKYLYVGRDGRDVAWSLYNHHANANSLWYAALNETPGRVGPAVAPPPEDICQYFDDWLEQDGYPFWPVWENVRAWWNIRHLPNLMLLHFADLKADMPGQILRIAELMDIPIDERRWPQILAHCSFDHMKRYSEKTVPGCGIFWEGGASTFVNKGTNGRWRDQLSPAAIARYDEIAVRELGEACARWLAAGEGTSQS